MGSSSKPLKTGTWSPDEDKRLREAVAQYGNCWVAVAAKVETRNGDQCAKRWNENLNPELDHSPWSPHEDRLLLHLVGTFGTNWKSIADNFLEGRAPLALKNRYSLLMRRMKRKRGGAKQLSGSSASASANASASTSGTTTAASSPLPSSTFGAPFDFTTAAAGLPTPPNFPLEDGESSATSLSGPQSLNGTEGDRTRPPTSHASPVDDVANQFMVAITDAGNSRTLVMSDACPPGNPPEAADLQGGGDQSAWQSFLSGANASSLSGHQTAGFHSSSSSSDLLLDSAFNSRSSTAFSIGPPLGEGLPDQPRATLADNGGNGNAIDLTLTCQRGNLRTVAYHLVDAAMSEIKRRAVEEEQVTLTLRLRAG
ncbi:hypothetical protein VTG60DRAFT_6132 [Thermothelomyces hinnuleus]